MSTDRDSGRGEIAPRPAESLIDEGRAERDAWRAANWDKGDPRALSGGQTWDREPEPYTPEEQASAEADKKQAAAADSHASRAAEAYDTRPRVTIVFSDEQTSWDPAFADWSAVGGQRIEPAAGAEVSEQAPELPESAYRSPEDVREALLAGGSVPEVRRDLAEQGRGSDEPTTDLYHADGDLRYERPELSDSLELDDDDKSPYDTVVERAKRSDFIDDVHDIGNFHISKFQALADQPKATGSIVGTASDHPAVREARSDDLKGGEIMVGPIAFFLVADSLGRWVHSKMGEWKKSTQGEPDNARN